MLENIRIKNFALIDEMSLEFSPGFNVITGETGAGKTIIMQAINLLLGERASKDILRRDADTCEISADIRLNKNLIKSLNFLQELGINFNEENLIVRRTVNAYGSKNFINDTPVSLQTLKSLGEILIDTHGPHEHQSVLKSQVQLQLLDNYANIDMLLAKTAEYFSNYLSCLRELEEFEKNIPDPKEESFLEHIVNEIRSANLLEGEEEELVQRHKILANAQQIIQSANNAIKILSDSEDSLLEKIFEINKVLLSIDKCDPQNISDFLAETDEIRLKVSALSESINDYVSKLEMDEREFLSLEERLRIINSLKRKYGNQITEILKAADDAQNKLEKIRNSVEIREKVSAKIANAKSEFNKAALELRDKRKNAAEKFSREVESELKKLGFLKSSFAVCFFDAEPNARGIDKIEFLFSANPGEELKPLRNIASSGEISRLMLAIKTVLATADSIPILIFDEIDSNIGGTTAAVVGKELAKLAKTHQLICISHLPQVAAEADRHFTVEKFSKKDKTFTKIEKVDGKKRVAEIARMLGGTSAAIKHAEEILSK